MDGWMDVQMDGSKWDKTVKLVVSCRTLISIMLSVWSRMERVWVKGQG